jgi:hypothetical protein
VNKYQLHQLINVVMEGAEQPDPIKFWKQGTEVMVFTFDWRGTGTTN